MNRRWREIERKRKADILLNEDDVDVRKTVAKKSPEDKAQWYRDENDKRCDEDPNKRRDFSQTKGTVEHAKVERSFKKEQDNFEPFEDWAVRQILLRRATDEKSAWDLFKTVLAKHEVPCIFARGQWLIGKFAGITMGQVQSDEMRAALKASQDLKERDDIDAFIAKSEELAGKSRKGLDTSYQSMAVPEVDGENHVDVCDVYGIVKDVHADSDKVMMRHLTQEMKKKIDSDEAEEQRMLENARKMVQDKKAARSSGSGGQEVAGGGAIALANQSQLR